MDYLKENESLILLLQLIKKNGNIESLRKHGLKYSQIAHLITELIKKDIVKNYENRVYLTNKGELLLIDLNKKLKRKNSNTMISPLKEYELKKIAINKVYLPEKF